MKRSKYHNHRQGRHDSKREARRAEQLQWMAAAGEISELREQVTFELVPKQQGERAVKYIADFVYRNKAGDLVVEDTKGFKTPAYRLKRKLMLWVHGIRILET